MAAEKVATAAMMVMESAGPPQAARMTATATLMAGGQVKTREEALAVKVRSKEPLERREAASPAAGREALAAKVAA